MGVYIPYIQKLPSEYQEVEYIQSTGTQWINTGLGVNQNTIMECKVNMQPGATYQYPRVYGVRNSGTGGLHFGLQWDRDNKYFYAVNYSNDGDKAHNIQTGTLEYNTDYTVKQTNTQLRINGVLQGTVSASTYSISYPLWLFNDEQAGSDFDRKANMKLYRLKMYSGTTLQRDFIPCYRKSDNVIGLYDLVNSVFYTNSGTGTFSKGNDVTMLELKNAYIGEVWTPTSNTVVYYNIDDNDTTSTIYDKSGNNYTLSGGTFSFYTDANAGRCYTGGSYSTLPSRAIINFGNSFTFITWCKPTSAAGPAGMNVFANGATSSTHASNGISVFQDDSVVGWSAGVNNYNLKVRSDEGAIGTYGQWKMIAYTRDNSGNLVLYINGVSIKTDTVSGSVVYPSSGQFLLGGWRSGDKQPWQGYIKCLIGENTTWTAEQMAGYYNQTKSNYGL